MKYFAYCRKSSEGEERQALSIPAQIDEINRAIADLPDVSIVEWFEEKMSAKAPGRPVYAKMIRRIENGEAEGIVAWHPDRLARNSVDGGWVIHLLDRKVLKNLKFVSYSYEQSPEGMFMLQIMFGQSKYYVDNLSVNVKRGIRKKIETGWWANLAPLGYRNDRDTGTIMTDAERFALLRRAWDLFLTGVHSVRDIHDLLNNEWGFRTPQRKKSGGRPISMSGLYKMFGNPFYAGILPWRGEWRPGKHEPMITLEELDRSRRILGRLNPPKPETQHFAFTGLIRCSCGLSVTAERKTKSSGRQYTYYHCTRSRRPNRCQERPVRSEAIEASIMAWLQNIHLPENYEGFISRMLHTNAADIDEQRERRIASAEIALRQAQSQLRVLVDLKIRGMIEDADFVERRQALQKEEFRLRQSISQQPNEPSLTLELGKKAVLFRKCAADWFVAANLKEKGIILQTLSSNSVLSGKTLSIHARFPFQEVAQAVDCLWWYPIVEALGTIPCVGKAFQLLVDNTRTLEQLALARTSRTPGPSLSP